MDEKQLTPESAQLALDEVNRRHEQSVVAGTRDWAWPWIGFAGIAMLVAGAGLDLGWPWLVALSLGAALLTSFRAGPVRARSGLGLYVLVGLVVGAGVIAFRAVGEVLDLPFDITFGMLGGALALAAVTPYARRRLSTRPTAR